MKLLVFCAAIVVASAMPSPPIKQEKKAYNVEYGYENAKDNGYHDNKAGHGYEHEQKEYNTGYQQHGYVRKGYEKKAVEEKAYVEKSHGAAAYDQGGYKQDRGYGYDEKKADYGHENKKGYGQQGGYNSRDSYGNDGYGQVSYGYADNKGYGGDRHGGDRHGAGYGKDAGYQGGAEYHGEVHYEKGYKDNSPGYGYDQPKGYKQESRSYGGGYGYQGDSYRGDGPHGDVYSGNGYHGNGGYRGNNYRGDNYKGIGYGYGQDNQLRGYEAARVRNQYANHGRHGDNYLAY